MLKKVFRGVGSVVRAIFWPSKFVPSGCARVYVYLTLIVATVGGGRWGVSALWSSEIPQIARDAIMSMVAHEMAGPKIPIAPDYTGGLPVDVAHQGASLWGVQSNSEWIVREETLIVPYYLNEKITPLPLYPMAVVFLPMEGETSLQLAGTVRQDPISGDWAVILNERLATDPTWIDQRELFSTLVHEMIHIQGGRFLDAPEETEWPAKSAKLESATVAASVEVMAAMCNDGNKLACSSFWYTIEGISRGSLAYHLRAHYWLYEMFANSVLRDRDQRIRHDKFWRDMADSQEDVWNIANKYQRSPWEDHIIKYLKYWLPLDTGMTINYPPQELNMPFDDTRYILGPWATLMAVLSK